jgi:hypothetical protein
MFYRSIKKNASLLALSTAMIAAQAQALTITQESSIALTTTDFTQSLSFDQFDSSLGTLTSVDFVLSGTVLGDAGYESRDSEATNITLNSSAIIKLSNPTGSTIVQTTPLASVTSAASASDGVIDFSGTSGATFQGVTNSTSESASLTSAVDLALFTGLNTIDLAFAATGDTAASGSGNLITQFSTEASADIRVVYHYETTAVPEPTAFILFGMGLSMLVVARSRLQGKCS